MDSIAIGEPLTAGTGFRSIGTMKTWAEMISDLQAAGMTYAQIAEKIGVAGSTVGDLATGRSKSPRGNAAVMLFALHKKAAPKDKAA